MEYKNAHSPEWANVNKDAVNLVIEVSGLGEIPFTATPTDTEPHGRALYERAIAGDFGPISDYVYPPPAPTEYPQFTALEMLDQFTEAEQLAVVAATMTEPAIKLWYDRLIAATYVTYEDPRTEAGLQALVDAELITSQRKAEIVAAMQPQET